MGGIIWLASFPKSGNTWVRAYLHNLLRNPPKPADINQLDQFCYGESSTVWYRNLTGDTPSWEATTEEIAQIRHQGHQRMAGTSPDSVFVKTHNYMGEWHDIPIHTMDVTNGAIYVVRNPLDVVLSFANHFGCTFDQAIDQMGDPKSATNNTEEHIPEVLSTWSMHVKSWTVQKETRWLHIVRYEDMLDKPFKTFNKVARFLGLNPPKARVQKAIKFSSFKSLKAQEQKTGFKEASENASSFFRSGKKGQWRSVLSDEQIRRVISDHGEQMRRFDYLPKGYEVTDAT